MRCSDLGHVILGVQSFSLDVFTKQMMLNEKNMWAVVEHFVKLISKQEDGHYVFLKDPMKGLIRVYRVPDEEVIHTLVSMTMNMMNMTTVRMKEMKSIQRKTKGKLFVTNIRLNHS